MTSKRYWSILIGFLLILSLVLAACVRPMPGGDELVSEEAPADGYPVPAEMEGEDGSPAAYPTGEEGNEAELIPPVDEGESAEAYPADEGAAVEGEPAEEEAVAGEAAEAYPATEDETAAGEALDAYPASEGESAEGGVTEEEAVEGEAPEGEANGDEAVETEAAEGEAAEGEAAEGEAAEGEAAETEGSAAETAATGRTHTVASGETLFQIGMQYGMSWVTIAQANDITNPNSLYPGQVLVIPDVEDLEAEAEAAAEPAAEEGAEEEAATGATTYIVQFGDTLYSISYRFGVNMMDIARENELASFDQIYAGQELIIPQADAGTEEAGEAEAEPGAEAATSGEGEVTHVVQEGETLFTIAFDYKIVWTDLVEANEIELPYTLEPGQTLIIPADD